VEACEEGQTRVGGVVLAGFVLTWTEYLLAPWSPALETVLQCQLSDPGVRKCSPTIPVPPKNRTRRRCAGLLSDMREELQLRHPQPGGVPVSQQLAYVMLVQALRLHLAEGLRGRVGWISAVG